MHLLGSFISFAIIVLLVQIKNYSRHHIAICAVLFLYNFNHKGVDGCTIADFALTIAFFSAISTDFVFVYSNFAVLGLPTFSAKSLFAEASNFAL